MAKKTMTKEDLEKGVYLDITGEYYYPEDDAVIHQSEGLAFNTKKRKCAQCEQDIEVGELISTGKRVISGGPLGALCVGVWTEQVHLDCCWDYRVLDDPISEVYKKYKPTELPGFESLSAKRKQQVLKEAGVEVSAKDVSKTPALAGMVCVITGEFPKPIDEIKFLVESHGARVVDTVPKSVKLTHLILGKPGTTPYGQKTGKGSKKYKEAMKKKPLVVDLKFIEDAISKNSLAAAAVKEVTMEDTTLKNEKKKKKEKESSKEEEEEEGTETSSDDTKNVENKQQKRQGKKRAVAADSEEKKNKNKKQQPTKRRKTKS